MREWKNCVYKRENMNMNEKMKTRGVDRSYVDWDLIPFHTSLNSSEKLPTWNAEWLDFIMGNSEGIRALKSQNQVVMQRTRKHLLKGSDASIASEQLNLLFICLNFQGKSYTELENISIHSISISWLFITRICSDGCYRSKKVHIMVAMMTVFESI